VTAPTPVRRTRYLVAVITCGVVVVVAIVLLVVLSQNVVYFRTVSEAVRERSSNGGDRFRLGGAVVPGSIHQTPRGVDFTVTDGARTVRVVHAGDPPDLFKANAPVLCEGRWGRGLIFDSDRILIKHGAEYEPPKVDADRAPKAERTERQARER
jgi:cytochrome c-type biogenesis protein CcmE